LKKLSKNQASFFLLISIIIIFVVGIAFAVYTLRSNPLEDAISGNRTINVLFVLEDEKKPVSTYVLMYYPATKRAAVFDIPGELGLLISRINRVDRIDSIYDADKIGNFSNEIEKLLGINIDFTIVITKNNLVSIVDLLEGVEIFIPSPVSHRDGDELILFPSGITVLDGDKASVYATYSLPFEDREIEVFRRQRFFMSFFDRQIQMNERLKNPDIAKLYHSFFKANINRRALMMLFNEFVYIDTNRTSIQSVGGNLREVSGQTLIIPHWDGNLVKEIVRQTLVTLTSDIEDHLREQTLTVEVLNGTAVNGLAGRTAEMLRSFGYDVISIGNADQNNYERTVIIHHSGNENLVRSFADVIRCTNIRRVSVFDEEPEEDFDSYEYKADITLLIGRNFNGRFVTGE
jgi:anionic cell wall polymer biosynthesis LytR-Cps2A-Psr (LCP) family protein